jgi:hypothetical protein
MPDLNGSSKLPPSHVLARQQRATITEPRATPRDDFRAKPEEEPFAQGNAGRNDPEPAKDLDDAGADSPPGDDKAQDAPEFGSIDGAKGRRARIGDATTQADAMPEEAGADLLDQVLANLETYVAFANRHQPVAGALWTAATHAIEAWQHATRLVITSPMKRCGKSRLMDVVRYMSHSPLACADATTAAIFRSIGDNPPTLFMDEADAMFGTKKAAERNEDLRALFNAGWQRGRPAIRCFGPGHGVAEFDTFAMVGIAAIKGLPDTITDRAVNIALQRRGPGEHISRFRIRRDAPPLKELGQRLGVWVASIIEELKDVEPDMPVEDRAADAWEPLIAIADAAGGDWPKKARSACKALCECADDADQELDTLLLTDINAIFSDAKQSFISSTELVRKLRAIEESPWGAFDLTVNRLAHRLKPYHVKSGHNTDRTVRGYHLDSFRDAFRRHIRPGSSKRQEQGPDLHGNQKTTSRPQDVPSDDSGLSDVRGTDVVDSEELLEHAVQSNFSDGWTDLDDSMDGTDHADPPPCSGLADPAGFSGCTGLQERGTGSALRAKLLPYFTAPGEQTPTTNGHAPHLPGDHNGDAATPNGNGERRAPVPDTNPVPPGGLTNLTPGLTDRVQRALTNARTARLIVTAPGFIDTVDEEDEEDDLFGDDE